MVAIIKQAVQEEINRRADTSNISSTQHEVNETSAADQVFSASQSREKRATSRLTNLLQQVRNGGKSSKRACKEHRLQVRWLHYNTEEKSFLPVKTKDGGGKRFIIYSDADSLSLEGIKNKGVALFFPNGISKFAGNLKDMSVVVCDTTQTAIFEFPEGGMIEDYLNANGLYPSATHFFIRTQAVQDIVEEFQDDDDILSFHDFCRQNINSEENSPNSNGNHQIQSDSFLHLCGEESAKNNSIHPDNQSSRCQGLHSSEVARNICDVCNCTYMSGQSCLRCQQNNEYHASLASDSAQASHEQLQYIEAPEEDFPDIEQLRDHRLTYLLRNQDPDNTESSNMPTISASNDHIPGRERHEEVDQQGEPPLQILVVHRTCIIMDMIKHFKNENVMKCELLFKVVNERGKEENGQGSGVNREVFCLFWNEFSNSMTIGETERVPFVRHDHFVKEWEAVGRILVKGYSSISYFPLFLSKAFMCHCLFGTVTEIPDGIVMDSFMKYLSPVEEELIKDYLGKSKFPEDNDELFDFLERFNCRSIVKESNLRKVLLEIAKQELVQKPHMILATWQPLMEDLKQYPQFQDCSTVQSFYDAIQPTTKKVLEKLLADPRSEGERDALKFLQRYIRGLDKAKLLQFLRFTTASDVLITEKISVSFTKLDGASRRPIAHTCGPLLELPSTYSNFVELREEFYNILSKGSWEMDIV